MIETKVIIRCYYCGNMVPCDLVFSDTCQLLFDEIENEDGEIEKVFNTFDFLNYKCSTCGGINLIGGFNTKLHKDDTPSYERLYPKGPNIIPPRHHWVDKIQPIPNKLVKKYEEIWSLKHQAPNAFGNQIRRCLEFICQDKGAKGKMLNEQLLDLTKLGYLPGTYKDISNIIRIIGNIGSHSSERELDFWDVELLDEFFRIIVDYIYVIPSKLKRLEQRIKT